MDTRIPTKLATALLLNEGEIALSDIEALPFVEDEQTARDITRYLTEKFDTYTSQRRISGAAASWEDVIVLRTPVPLQRSGGEARQAANANARHREDFDGLLRGQARSYG